MAKILGGGSVWGFQGMWEKNSLRSLAGDKQNSAGWWFQTFFIFTPIWGRFPFWLIFFKWVETTNQSVCVFFLCLWIVDCVVLVKRDLKFYIRVFAKMPSRNVKNKKNNWSLCPSIAQMRKMYGLFTYYERWKMATFSQGEMANVGKYSHPMEHLGRIRAHPHLFFGFSTSPHCVFQWNCPWQETSGLLKKKQVQRFMEKIRL